MPRSRRAQIRLLRRRSDIVARQGTVEPARQPAEPLTVNGISVGRRAMRTIFVSRKR
jgi:hypothetical protein